MKKAQQHADDRDQQRLVHAEDALRQAQNMESIGQLTGGIAHDFNNVLHAVQGSLQLIKRVPQDPRVQEWAGNALRSIKRGAELTSQLLTFACEQKLELRLVSVTALVDGMQEMIGRSIGPLVRLRVIRADDDAAALRDATQLEMAILNLAINARDAMPAGGLLTIETRIRLVKEHGSLAQGKYIEIKVSDTGSGMPADVAARTFEPFFMTKGVGKGTGLGLSQVCGLALQAGGEARIDSDLGRGTTVTIFLPRAC